MGWPVEERTGGMAGRQHGRHMTQRAKEIGKPKRGQAEGMARERMGHCSLEGAAALSGQAELKELERPPHSPV